MTTLFYAYNMYMLEVVETEYTPPINAEGQELPRALWIEPQQTRYQLNSKAKH